MEGRETSIGVTEISHFDRSITFCAKYIFVSAFSGNGALSSKGGMIGARTPLGEMIDMEEEENSNVCERRAGMDSDLGGA